MRTLSLLVVLSFSASVPALSQPEQPRCSATLGAFQMQSTAISRTGIGAAYSLTATIKAETKTSNGATLTGFTTSRQMRDSSGRTRVESPLACDYDKENQPHWDGSINVIDPTLRTYTRWEEWFFLPRKKILLTHRPDLIMVDPPSADDEYRKAKTLSSHASHLSSGADGFKLEDLGKREIAGLMSSGIRTTRTRFQETQADGSPTVYVEEKWISDKYAIITKDVIEDPTEGRVTYEVSSFTIGEPDTSLFQPPAEYEVIERTVAQ